MWSWLELWGMTPKSASNFLWRYILEVVWLMKSMQNDCKLAPICSKTDVWTRTDGTRAGHFRSQILGLNSLEMQKCRKSKFFHRLCARSAVCVTFGALTGSNSDRAGQCWPTGVRCYFKVCNPAFVAGLRAFGRTSVHPAEKEARNRQRHLETNGPTFRSARKTQSCWWTKWWRREKECSSLPGIDSVGIWSE